MKFTLSWLKDHLETSASLPQLTEKLASMGLDVEGVDDPAAKLAPFTIARVLEAKPHPNADKLQVCKVDTGSRHGRGRVRRAQRQDRHDRRVRAHAAATSPAPRSRSRAKPVRGVVSQGMLVSERELELSDDHEGIIELDAELGDKLGKRYADVLGLADPVIDVKLTPNRPDCTGVRGIARDLAAAGIGKLKPEKKITGVEGDYDCPVAIELDFPKEARDACPCFAGRYIRGVSNGASPAWMQQRLKAVGLRPINALVDVTNYISLDRGRPLHVYDADKLTGAIRARLGKKGEKFAGLDGKTHEADDTMCVIADDRAVLGFGGILGGEDTGCTDATKNVLIECAYFDPLRTAATGRKTGIVSDARYRFERGVDPAFILPGLDLATAMMTGGVRAARRRSEGCRRAARDQDRHRSSPSARVEKLAGIKLEEKQIRATLQALGFAIEGKGATVKVTAPSWRPDVHGAADLVEEVVRIVGLDKVPSAPMPRSAGVARAVLTETQRRVRRARRTLAGARPGRGHHLVVHSARAGAGLRRRPGRPRARQPDLERDVVDAPEPAAGPARRRAEEPQPRLCRPRPVRGRPGLSRRRARGPVHRRFGRARRRRGAHGQRPPLGGRRRRPSLYDAKADVVGAACRARLRCRQGAGDARGAGLVPSGTLGHAPARPQDHARPLRRAASRDAARARCRRPRCRVRGVPRGAAAAAKEGAARARRSLAADLLPVRRDFAFVLDARGARPATSSRRRSRPTRS